MYNPSYLKINEKESLKSRCLRDSHNLNYVAVCLNTKCQDNMVCPKCLISKHIECKDDLLFIEDVFGENTSAILSTRNFVDLKVLYEKIIRIDLVNIDKDSLIMEINKNFTNVIDKFTVKLNDLKNNLVTIINDKFSSEISLVKEVDSFLKYGILREFLRELGLGEDRPEFNKFLSEENKTILQWAKTATNEEKVSFLKNYDTYIRKDMIDYYKKIYLYSQMQREGELMKKINSIFDELNTFLDEKLSWNNLSLMKYETSSFKFHTNRKSSLIELDSTGLRAKKTLTAGYDAIIGNIKLTKGSELVKWEVVLHGLEANDIHTENQWICFGIVEEDLVNSVPGLANFPYSRCIGYSTFNQSYNIIVENGVLQRFLNDDVIEMMFDSEKGFFEILNLTNNFKAQHINLNLNIVYYPFVILYAPGNCVELKFKL
jgi:hypothetical protein